MLERQLFSFPTLQTYNSMIKCVILSLSYNTLRRKSGNEDETSELEFLKSLWGLGTEKEEGYSTGPPGYIGWRNSFLRIDFGGPIHV
jgi:hypothetical protein